MTGFKFLARLGFALAVAAMATLVYVVAVTHFIPGAIQGPAGPQGAPGSTCAGPSCPLNRTYASFNANFTFTGKAAGQAGLTGGSCVQFAYGEVACGLSITNAGPTTFNVGGLSYPLYYGFNYIGADPTLGNIHVEAYQTVDFVLWFQVLQPTGAINETISLAVA